MWSNWRFLLFLNLVGTKQMTKTITKTFTFSDKLGTPQQQYQAEMTCYNKLFDCSSPFLSRLVGANPETHTIKMERMTRDLFTQIVNLPGSINHRNLLYDMICGLEALRQYDFSHRDIKPENVLYDEGTGVYKLTDFGLSECTTTKRRSHRGSTPYILPMHTHIAKGYNWGQANDKYGIGVVAHVAKTGKFPYHPPKNPDGVNTLQHWMAMKTFMKQTTQQTTDDEDMNRIAKYFQHEVLPMIDDAGTDAAIRAAILTGIKRARE
jgi:serine/threonine protein kinase